MRTPRALVPLLVLGAACVLLRDGTAAPKVIGAPSTDVRVHRGTGVTAPGAAPAAAASPADPDAALTAPAPAATDPTARAWIARMVDAYGGAAALLDWTGRGERRGLRVTTRPVQVEARFVERRAGGAVRLDLRLAGIDYTIVSTPEGDWQSVYGIVSEMPAQEKETLAALRAHDETMLLEALNGRYPARLDSIGSSADTVAVLVWGSRGSATRFRAARSTGQLATIDFVDRNPEGEGDAHLLARLADWRTVGSRTAPHAARREGAVPLASIEHVDGNLIGATYVDTLDLVHEIPGAVFERPDAPREGVSPRRSILTLTRVGEHHFVEVRFDDGVARNFLVDSGAAVTAISNELAQALGLPTGSALDVAGVAGSATASSVGLPPFSLGAHRVTGVAGVALDLETLGNALGVRLDGLLGTSAFARFAVTWDFARSVLEITETRDPLPSSETGTRVPFTMAGGLVFVPVRVDGGPATDFVVDTGAWWTFLPAKLGRAAPNPPTRRLPGIPYAGVGGRAASAEGFRIRSLDVGGAVVPRPIVLAPSTEAGEDALAVLTRDRGLLGLDVLRRFRMSLDFPRQEMVLEWAAQTPDDGPMIVNFCGPGIVLAAGEGFTGAPVERVLDDSPAARAGLRPGDRVLAIDGSRTGMESAAALNARLAGAVGTSLRLRVRTGTEPERTVALTRALLL